MVWRNFSFGLTGLLLGTFLSGMALAQDLNVSVSLSQLERIQASEKSGDELYFSITEYSSKERPNNHLVPEFPMHWLSDYLKDVKNVTLWEKVVKEGESVEVIISLIERDIPPWNMDDLIGTVKVKIQNTKGKLTKEWSIPNQNDTQAVAERKSEFILKGANAEYRVALKLEQKVAKADSDQNKSDNKAKLLEVRPSKLPSL